MCKHYDRILNENDRHYVICPELNNCVFCLIEQKGPMTQKDIGKYLGLCKMRINQLEKIAKRKFIIRSKFCE